MGRRSVLRLRSACGGVTVSTVDDVITSPTDVKRLKSEDATVGASTATARKGRAASRRSHQLASLCRSPSPRVFLSGYLGCSYAVWLVWPAVRPRHPRRHTACCGSAPAE